MSGRRPKTRSRDPISAADRADIVVIALIVLMFIALLAAGVIVCALTVS